MKNQPWYKRAAIWIILFFSGVVGAVIMFFSLFRKSATRLPVPPPPRSTTRETTDQNLEGKQREVSDAIERSEKSARSIDISDNASITDTNRALTEARERRRIAGYWPAPGGADRNDQDD